MLTVEKAQTLLAWRVADGVLTLLVWQDKIKPEDKKEYSEIKARRAE